MPETFPQLRYQDRPSVEVEIVIDAAPEDVFALVTDIEVPARFSSEFRGAEWIEGATGPEVGARFVGRNEHPAAGEWQTTCTVTEYDPPSVFAYEVGGMSDQPGTTWRFTLTPEEGGRTRLAQFMQMGPGRSFINAAIDAMPEKESRILNRRVHEHRDNMTATLAGMKRLLEGGEGSV